jgi:Response regulator containing CheY-like receiver domain and AraC-type DNA-binding domain
MENKKFSLLLADDEEHILNGIKNYIQKRSAIFQEIYCARNGQEALDMIYQHHPDVMLLDVQMPVKNGLEIMKEANAAHVCPKTILLSGYESFEYVREALRQGAADYLLKPCRSTEILEKLEAVAGPSSGQKKAAASSKNTIVEQAVDYIKAHLPEDLNLSMTAEHVGVSNAYLSTLFTQNLGCSFVDYLNRTRIEYACDYMHDGRMKIYEIAFKVGFRDEKYFSKVFKKVTGQSPTEYRAALGSMEK